VSPATAQARAGADGRPEAGALPGPEARRLLDGLQHAGLRAELRNASRVSYLAPDRTPGLARVEDDERKARRRVEEVLRAGVPVVERIVA
jgi:hypothetical protein